MSDNYFVASERSKLNYARWSIDCLLSFVLFVVLACVVSTRQSNNRSFKCTLITVSAKVIKYLSRRLSLDTIKIVEAKTVTENGPNMPDFV